MRRDLSRELGQLRTALKSAALVWRRIDVKNLARQKCRFLFRLRGGVSICDEPRTWQLIVFHKKFIDYKIDDTV